MKLLLLPLLFLLLNANELAFKSNNIIFSEKTNQSCSVKFRELLNEGLGSHPSMNLSKDIIKGADYQVESAMWGYFPTPSIDVSARSEDRRQIIARVDQPLWTGGKLDSAYEKAKSKKSEAVHTYDENQFKLIGNYLNTLQNYLQAKQKIEVLKKNKNDFESLAEMLDRMADAGISSQNDKDLLDSRLSKIHSDIVIAKSKLKVSRIQFEILTGRAIECVIDFDYKPVFNASDIKIEKLIKDILEFHPSLKIVDSQIETAASEISSSKSKLWPSLILRGEYRNTNGLYEDGIEATTEKLAYLTFQVSTGSGLSLLSNINEAKVNLSKAQYDKKVKERDLIDELMLDYTDFITANSNTEILAKNIATLENIYVSNKRLYLSQNKQWLDLVNSLSELNQEKIIFSDFSIQKEILEYKISLKTGKINLDTGEILGDI